MFLWLGTWQGRKLLSQGLYFMAGKQIIETDKLYVLWASSGSWWWMRNPGVVQSMGFQRVGYNTVTELSWSCMSGDGKYFITERNSESWLDSQLRCRKNLLKVTWLGSEIMSIIILIITMWRQQKIKSQWKYIVLEISVSKFICTVWKAW